MKMTKRYVCEICGTEYRDEKMAVNCEKGHRTPVEITGMRYAPITNDATGYPQYIIVRMSSGEKVAYKRAK